MKQSRLRLEHYNLMHLHLEPVIEAASVALGSYANFEQASFGSEVAMRPFTLQNDDVRYSVELKLSASPKEGQKDFPYSIRIGLIGVFDGRSLPEEKRDQLVVVNGASMLYGIAREIVLSLTSRSVGGPVMLPTVEFSELGEDIDARQRRVADAKQGNEAVALEPPSIT
jgi:preprotein translocase subunit SecB